MSHDGAFDFSGSASVAIPSWRLRCIDTSATKKKRNSLASDIKGRLVTHKRSMDVTHIYIVMKSGSVRHTSTKCCQIAMSNGGPMRCRLFSILQPPARA